MVTVGGWALSEIDTRSLSVLAPPRAGGVIGGKASAQPRKTDTRASSGTLGIALPIGAAALLLAVALVTVGRLSGKRYF
jgi:hypothetical protein